MIHNTLGLADLAGRVFAGANLDPLWTDLLERASTDTGAMLDASTILQLVGQRDQGLALQADALARGRLFRRVHGDGSGLRVLALVTGGDMMANIPVDFLLARSNATLDLLYMDLGHTVPSELPEHDVAILAIGQSGANDPLLRALAPLTPEWPRPLLNARAERVLDLARDLCAMRMAGIAGLIAPPSVRVLPKGAAAVGAALGWPLLARPVDSHAGQGLEKLEGPAALDAYLAQTGAAEVLLSPFVDYAAADGLYRKYRIVLIGGRPFLAHMAISSHWMVHYLNAGMAEDAGKRAEEAAAMEGFETGFAARHAAALAALARRLDLDYFAIDCAETADGRLLVFEADTAVIVHDMDPPDLYPYKAPAMARLFAGFEALLKAKAAQSLSGSSGHT